MKKILLFVLMLAVAAVAFVLGRRFSERDVRSVAAPGGGLIASVTERVCLDGRCQVLWLGAAGQAPTKVATLNAGQTCDEIAWTNDGTRVAFLVDGYQLRLYTGASAVPAGQITLIVPDAQPTTRIARGITFSENGRAITFDDCPRGRSGCRSGLTAVPQ
jgi:hypothetical protein